MKSTISILVAWMVVVAMGGCNARIGGAASGTSNDPAAGAVAAVAGLVDATVTNQKQKGKESQKSVDDYLERKPRQP